MKRIYFKCTLLTDVVLNQKAATEGNQESLDFIPGNNFLGIAASKLYYKNNEDARLDKESSLKVFHSGDIKFGDAHPAEVIQEQEKDVLVKRSVRIPASFYKPKLNNKDGFYIYHEVDDHEDDTYLQFQPKQCRTGFYVFENETLREVSVGKSFAIKSAYDRKTRRSEDQKMYGYESLLPGSVWIFDVTMGDASFEAEIKAALSGTGKIGRSRTAQYGLVEIEEVTAAVADIEKMPDNPDCALVYADSRLIFLDEYGIPTFSPDAEKDFGFIGGKIDWTKTQIRTFQYAPWNGIRQARDADRCGIEKGSVFYIVPQESNAKLTYPQNTFVGKYQHEGFGKIVINPAFLKAKMTDGKKENGKALYTLQKMQEESDTGSSGAELPDASYVHPLFQFLENKKKEVEKTRLVYQLVNNFADDKGNIAAFTGDLFASQWGAIRSIALMSKGKSDLQTKLFGDEGYLTRGVAKDKWEERGRLNKLKKFLAEVDKEKRFNDRDVLRIVINLAAEMAKISGRK